MKVKKFKKFMTVVMAAALVLGIGKTPVFACESDFEVTGLVMENAFTGTGAYDYVGYASLNGAPVDSKYLELTYTGNITYLRLEFEDKDGEANATCWFNPDQPSHFVTTADSAPIQLDTASDVNVIIDLAASGIDISKYAVEGGLHIHYGDVLLSNGTFQIKAAKLTGGAENEQQSGNEQQPGNEQQSVDVQATQGVFPLDSMNKTLKTSSTGGYKYGGWVSFDGAPEDSKYLEFDYTGDISTLRIEVESEPGNKVGKTLWFAPEHEDDGNTSFVNANGGEFPLTGGSVKVDLAASGIDVKAVAAGKGGIQMHYGDDENPNPSLTATITNARLTGNTVVETPVTTITAEGNQDISVTGSADIIPENSKFIVTAVESGDAFNSASTVIRKELGDKTNFKVFDMILKNAEGVEIHELNGKVTVTLPVPAGLAADKLVVYRLGDDGTLVKCEFEVKDGKVAFTTDHFSIYILAEKAVTQTTDQNANQPTTNDNKKEPTKAPKTGDTAEPIALVGLLALSVVGIVYAGKKKVVR